MEREEERRKEGKKERGMNPSFCSEDDIKLSIFTRELSRGVCKLGSKYSVCVYLYTAFDSP